MSGDPPNMLTYESAMPGRISSVRQAAWISVLTLGILTTLGGICAGGLLAIVLTWMPASMSVPKAPAPWVWLLVPGYFIIPGILGTAEIICSVKIRRRSVVAARFGAVLVGFQVLLLGGHALTNILRTSGPPDPVIVTLACVLYGAITCVLAVMEWLLIRIMREPPSPNPGTVPIGESA